MTCVKAKRIGAAVPEAASARGGQEGFTLIETMVSAAIMSIVSLGTISLFSYAMGYNTDSNNRAIAIAVAQQRVEQLRNVPFTDSSLTATSSGGSTATVQSQGESFQVVTTITDVNTDSNEPSGFKQKKIVVTVTPQGGAKQGVHTPVTIMILRTSMATGLNLG